MELPVAIAGTRNENPVVLCRQDWRGAPEWHDLHVGGWSFDVSQSGAYEITLSFTDVLRPDVKVHPSLHGTSRTATMTQGETSARWSPVKLESGRVRLDGRLEVQGNVQGVSFVTIHRLDLPDSVAGLRFPYSSPPGAAGSQRPAPTYPFSIPDLSKLRRNNLRPGRIDD